MKKVILALAVVSFFAACNSSESTEAPKNDSPVVAAPAADTTAKPADTTAKPAADTTAKPAADTTKK